MAVENDTQYHQKALLCSIYTEDDDDHDTTRYMSLNGNTNKFPLKELYYTKVCLLG